MALWAWLPVYCWRWFSALFFQTGNWLKAIHGGAGKTVKSLSGGRDVSLFNYCLFFGGLGNKTNSGCAENYLNH
jgi:hypothetical protein